MNYPSMTNKQTSM